MRGDVISVPLSRPQSWAPSWDEAFAGIQARRRVDWGNAMAAAGRTLQAVDVQCDTALQVLVDAPDSTGITLHVTGTDPAAGNRVVAVATFDDGSQDEVQARQPIRAAPAAGLQPGTTAATPLLAGTTPLSVDGDPLYIGDTPQ